MPLCVQELDQRGIQIPVLIGGAAINRRFGRRALFVDGERAYESGVFYCKDAFEGLETMDALQDAGAARGVRRAARSTTRATTSSCARTSARTSRAASPAAQRSDVAQDNPVPAAPFCGHARRSSDIPLDEVFELLDLDELYRLQWGGTRLGRRVRDDRARRVRARRSRA